MISGINLNETISYTLKDDTENPTVWKIGVLPSSLSARINTSETDQVLIFYKYLQFALRGWENSDVPFEVAKEKHFGKEYVVVPMSVLDKFEMKVIVELYVEAMRLARLTDTERKNS